MITRKLTKHEILFGALYLSFSLLLLPIVLTLGNLLLPVPVNDAYVNLVYFAVNFIAVCVIFSPHIRCAFHHGTQHIPGILITAISGFGAYLFCSLLLGIIIQNAFPEFVNLNDAGIYELSSQHFWVMTFSTVILVPVAEELFHRGLVFGTLWHKNHLLAYSVSIVLFCSIHVAGYIGLYEPIMLLVSFIQYVPAGLFLAWAYRKADNILAPILMHAAINAVGMLAMR